MDTKRNRMVAVTWIGRILPISTSKHLQINPKKDGTSDDISELHVIRPGKTMDDDESTMSSSSNTPAPPRSYTHKELEVFDLIQHPVWVFDIEQKKMFWANIPALEIWNAATLEELLARDFTKMSGTIERRMNDQLVRIKRGEVLHEQWTAYPKGKPKTLAMSGSAIGIGGGRVGALCETELLRNTDFKNAAVRGVEILRYLPIAVSQFDIEGKVAYQNPESMGLFGGAQEADTKQDEKDESTSQFLGRFVDRTLGKHVLEQVQQGKDCNVEAEQYTKDAPRSFSVSVRRTTDPVTSKPIILYSARDISEIIQARKDQKKASYQSDFMAAISHELRTPLHQIIGYMDLLELTDLSPPQFEAVKMAQVSSVSLMAIIGDLLDYSMLKNGKLMLDKTLFDPSVVVNACLAAIEKEAGEKGLVLENNQIDVPGRLLGDPNRLRQILLNLLSNAVKFTERGKVSLRTTKVATVDSDKERIRFEVMDTGVGIHSHYHDRVFEKYEHANATIARNYGGTGLGLTICKSLTERMGGEISLQSELGKGTTMSIEIPFELPAKAPNKRPKVSTRSPTGDTKSLRVLVVEDNLVNQKMVKRMLQRMGHTVTVAEHGKAAIHEIEQSESFDFVFMDVQMPILDGIDATKRIREMPGMGKSDLPIVGLTATFERSALPFYQDIGMNHCIGKPATMKVLKLVVETYAIAT